VSGKSREVQFTLYLSAEFYGDKFFNLKGVGDK